MAQTKSGIFHWRPCFFSSNPVRYRTNRTAIVEESAETAIRIGNQPVQSAIFLPTAISACIRLDTSKFWYVPADTVRTGRYLKATQSLMRAQLNIGDIDKRTKLQQQKVELYKKQLEESELERGKQAE
ncbi:hypothetical protein RHMOL_Rhmol02G0239700 [Rhododendron molle]|uniref:Uncharacterized protein n=1 Tax=Rhododendron molle TaxID=49168 RepID=A0ACC0PUV4_RHOML|nr:hypothetical protein RHMOL_Rhmol02G0239700 [Rhododendron molle]